MTETLSSTNTYGDILRLWRKQRRFSQLALSLQAGISSRHLSFLESGRAQPSRNMILKLADHLEMPKPEINRALLSAGFAPAYKARPQADADLAPVHGAITALLANHMPYPAIAMDRYWTITNANEAAINLLGAAGFSEHTNFLEALAVQSPEDSSIINWQETVGTLLVRLQAELSLLGDDDVLAALTLNLQAHFNLHCADYSLDRTQAILPTRFRIGDAIISVFSTIAQFGTVQDITLDDLKVELMFPMDEASDAYFRDR